MSGRELPERAWFRVAPSGALHHDPRPSATVGPRDEVEYVRADVYDRLRADAAAREATLADYAAVEEMRETWFLEDDVDHVAFSHYGEEFARGKTLRELGAAIRALAAQQPQGEVDNG